jgi:leucyl/phenylalanyl-tRNA--protein transferase
MAVESHVIPREPLPSRYRMPDPRSALPNGLLAAGGDLAPGTVLAAYRSGVFPWPDHTGRLLWWSPDPRAVLFPEEFHESRSLRRKRRRNVFEVTMDQAYEEVLAGCADRAQGTWITPAIRAAYLELYRLGWVHTIEVRHDGHLIGGLYGVAIGRFFAAESMFHRETDASKVALAELVERCRRSGVSLIDVQFLTPHLASLGAREIPREQYLERLHAAIASSVQF